MPKPATASFSPVTPITGAASATPLRVNQLIQRARLAQTAAEITAAINDAEQLATVVRGEIADAKRDWGETLLDSTDYDRETHDSLVRALGHETEQLAAILETLRTRQRDAEQREELAAGDAKIARAVELSRASRKSEAAYEANAKRVAADLSAIAESAAEFLRIERELERLGRTEDVNVAVAGAGGPPGAVKGVGLLHDTSDATNPVVRLPAVSHDGMIWGPR